MIIHGITATAKALLILTDRCKQCRMDMSINDHRTVFSLFLHSVHPVPIFQIEIPENRVMLLIKFMIFPVRLQDPALR